MTTSNKYPKPAAVGAVSSAVAVNARDEQNNAAAQGERNDLG
ncbi:MAG: hypothetical protein JWR69_3809 [Pedosphaera sp.]|nr:hypothetical protein [Pedosphaera sp.]